MTILRTNLVTTTDDKRILGPTGSVLQSQFVNFLDVSQPLTTSITYIPTNISLTFKPIQSTSKLYIKYTFDFLFASGTGDGGCMLRIYRDGVAINTANNSDNFCYRSNATTSYFPGKIVHYVNASTTNPTTFQVYQRSYDGEGAAVSPVWGTNSMLILEVAS